MPDRIEGGDVIVVPLAIYRVTQTLRKLLVITHGATGLCLGVASMVRPPDDHNPSFSTLRHIPGWPVTWATWVFVAGLTVLIGVTTQKPKLCRWGLLAMSGWTTTMIFGYLSAAIFRGGAMWHIPLYFGLTFSYTLHAAYYYAENEFAGKRRP